MERPTHSRFAYLLSKYIDGTASRQELVEFSTLLQREDADEKMLVDVQSTLEGYKAAGDLDPQHINDMVMAVANQQVLQRKKEDFSPKSVHRVHFLKTAWFRYAAAIVIVLGVGAYLWTTNTHEKPIVQQDQMVAAAKDVEPGGNKATLTLSDGKIINLDEVNNGELATDGGARVVKSADGQIMYNAASSTASLVYNTMSTPRGGQYQLTLPDGSRVWLNAASSITYPTIFTGKDRLVKVIGEAYFEVTKNAAKPFVVNIDEQMKVKVLGTQFNINAYKEEGKIKTSLVEGAVQIGKNVLRPGQAWVDGKVRATNTDQDVAWKNGLFNFNKMSLQDAMHQISRWYNIRVVYQKGIPDIQLWGEMGRDLNLQQVLDILSGMEVHYRMESGNKLIILP